MCTDVVRFPDINQELVDLQNILVVDIEMDLYELKVQDFGLAINFTLVISL